MNTLNKEISALIAEQKNQSRLRQLKTVSVVSPSQINVDGNVLVNFASNDYLGLSQHPFLKQKSIEAINKYGVGSPSSRLISGNCELYDVVESRLADLKGTEASLVFPTGFQANLSIMIALSKLKSVLLCDQLSHNSILLGARYNQKQFARFAHNNIEDLERLRQKFSAGNQTIWAVTESVFSMGNVAPINDFIKLSQNNNLHLYIDEAHATGVYGHNGMGFVHAPKNNNVVMGTFGKGCGSFGAYIACSLEFKDFLVNFCPGIIYTTALPPAVLGSILGALELIPHMVPEREHLLSNSHWLRKEITGLGFKVQDSTSHIVYLPIGSDTKTILLSRHLAAHNIYAPAIRPPTVPDSSAGIRLSLSVAHTEADLSQLINALKKWYQNNN